jgi:hypothetical protein
MEAVGRKPTIWETLTNEKNFKWTLVAPLLIILVDCLLAC